MHHRWQFTIAVAALLLVSGAPGAEASKLGVYFDEYGEESRLQVDPGQPFQFYVSASEISGEIYGFECELEIDPLVTVTGRAVPHSRHINVGAGDNWIVGLGEDVSVSGTLVLVEYAAVLLSDGEGLRINIQPANVSGSPPMPRYLLRTDPPNGELLEFDVATGASINAETESWGTLKDNFKEQ